MPKNNTPKRTIGLDVGNRNTRFAVGEGQRGKIRVLEQGALETTREGLRGLLAKRPRARVVLEVGRQSPWISRLVRELGHEVLVADARKLAFIYKSHKKNDREDARKLMELAHIDPDLLSPVEHRSAQTQAELSVMRARDVMVATRTRLINHVRGSCSSVGVTLPSSSAPAFQKKCAAEIPRELRPALSPLLKTLEVVTRRIRQFDEKIEVLCAKHPATQRLRQVNGVGALTALCFVLTIEKPERFNRSRQVAPYIGLCPRQDDSGDQHKQLRISKTGDATLRRLLVSSAQYILGPFAADSDLRRWGQKLAERGGKNAKKRAVVAVARKLAVLLHALWVKPEPYDRLRHSDALEAKTGQRIRIYRLTDPSTRLPLPSGEGAAPMSQ